MEVFHRLRSRTGVREYGNGEGAIRGRFLELRGGGVTFGFAVIIVIASIPIHVTQEMKPKEYMYVDGLGRSASFVPRRGGNFTGVNARLWSDFFVVVPPSSPNGFWSDWVAEHGGNVVRLMALLLRVLDVL